MTGYLKPIILLSLSERMPPSARAKRFIRPKQLAMAPAVTRLRLRIVVGGAGSQLSETYMGFMKREVMGSDGKKR